MRKYVRRIRMWFWAASHAWTLARRAMNLQQQVGYAQIVDVCAKQGVIVAIRGSRNGWSATLGKRMDIKADSFQSLIATIADLPNRASKEV
jgi:hypothetical protein